MLQGHISTPFYNSTYKYFIRNVLEGRLTPLPAQVSLVLYLRISQNNIKIITNPAYKSNHNNKERIEKQTRRLFDITG